MRGSEEMQKGQQSCKDLALMNFPAFKVKRDPVTCLAPLHTPQGPEGWSVMSASACLERSSLFPELGVV